MGPARAARHRPYNACPLLHTGAASSPTSGMSMVPGRRRQPKPAHSPSSRLPARASPAWAAPPSLATTADSDRRRLRSRRSAQGRGRVVEAARSEPHLLLGRSITRRSPRRVGVRRENQRARREVELASVRDCYDDPHRRSLTAAPTPHPASLPRPLPIPPATNLTAGVRGVPARRPHPGRWSHQAA
jgi:hypothetical protein